MSRKRISKDAKLAALTMLHFGIPYAHAKLMSDDHMNSLVHWHHNVHHCAKGKQTVVEDVDHFSNLEPMLIAAHRAQTKRDRKTIAKIDRTRKKLVDAPPGFLLQIADAARRGFEEGARHAYDRIKQSRDRYSENYDAIDWDNNLAVLKSEGQPYDPWAPIRDKPKRKIRSRGFDKTRRRTMRGKVAPFRRVDPK